MRLKKHEETRERDYFLLDACYDELGCPAEFRKYPECRKDARELISRLMDEIEEA